MADNTRLNPGKSGNLIASDEISINGTPVHVQRVKLIHGPDGEATDGDVQHENPLPTLPSSHMYSKGVITGHETLRKFGINSVVAQTEEFIEPTGTALPYFPTTAVQLEVISDDANDTAAGTGAQSIILDVLDDTWTRQTITIVTNGTSASTATTGSYFRVLSAKPGAVGTYGGKNIGNIIIRASGGGTAFTTMVAGTGRTQTTAYTVGAGFSLFIKDVHITTETAKSSNVYFWQRMNANDVTTPFSPTELVHEYIGIAGSPDFEYTPELYFPAYTDLWFTGTVSAATGAISIEYNGVLETA